MLELGERKERKGKDDDDDDEFESLVRGGGIMNVEKPWYARPCSKREIAWVVALALVTLILAIVLMKNSNDDTRPICETEECVKLAGNVLSSMDTSVDPCEDFHVYACGNWEAKYTIPDDKSRLSTFTLLSEENTAKLRTLLESDGVENEATIFYDSCMDLETLESVGSSPLNEFMLHIQFSSSSVDTWNEQSLDELSEMLAYLSRLGVEPLLGMGIGSDDQDSNRNVVWIGQGGLTLPSREYYVGKDIDQDETLGFLQSHITEFFELLFNSNISSPLYAIRPSDARAVSRKVVEFEKKLAEIFATKVELRQPSFYYNPTNLSSLESTSPVLRWRTLLRPLLESGYRYDQRVSESNDPVIPSDDDIFFANALGSDEKLIVETVSYLQSLESVLNESGREAVLWYLRWHLLSSFAHHLSKAFRDKAFEMSKSVYGVETMSARWKICTSRANYYRSDDLGKMFVDKHFKKESLSAAQEMVSDLKDATIENFNRLPWMDSETRNAAVEKCERIVDKIGYPNFYENPNGIRDSYKGWSEEVTLSSYFQNVLHGREFLLSKSSSSLRKPVDKSVWAMSPPEVNAYYSPSKNEIVFPAGILQPPFYSKDFPDSFNYGGIGAVIGHELSHGFDDSGANFDENGNFNPWWSESSRESFEVKTNCMKRQYSSYSLSTKSGDRLYINGNLTIGENIADNGGLKNAHAAWLKRDTLSKTRRALPGLDLTNEQLLFVSYAQVWCSLYREDSLLAQLRSDPHSPGKFRIIGPLSNSLEFSNAFKCDEDDQMRSSSRCEVW
jgi:predicted metalloendopeptidase